MGIFTVYAVLPFGACVQHSGTYYVEILACIKIQTQILQSADN